MLTSNTEKKPLNILMLSPTMFFADYGAHVRILEETRTLQKRGHKVTILAYPNGRDIEGIDVRRCWGVPFNYRVIVGSSRHKVYLDALLAAMSLWHTLRDTPDIIHAHLHEGALIGWFLSQLTGAPLVFDFQGSLTSEMIDHNFLRPGGLRHKLMYWLEHRIDHAADVVMPSSAHAANLLSNEFNISNARIDPTPDCVNADIFSPSVISPAEKEELKQSLGIPAHKKVIAYLGLLAPHQGVNKLLEALTLLKPLRDDYHLLLMGFPAVAQYQELAQELGVFDEVTFTGKISYEDAPRYLALGDIATAPKISTTEGSGKILNYMSMALPTVAYSLPVSREFLGDAGIYASEISSAALAAALNRALDLPEDERQRLGRYLRRRVKYHFSWDKAGQQIEAIYYALMAGTPLPVTQIQPATENI
ncbi:glycosyltransferase family 4 protein [Anaerolineales bacterium HSG6]|nr:glycosyltransferase family 4 protein [Anaerolineales bacterium HSG6]